MYLETKTRIKSFKPAHHLSEESLAFTGKLYIGNKAVADVRNQGHGGATSYYTIDPKDDWQCKLQDLIFGYEQTKGLIYEPVEWFITALAYQEDELLLQKKQTRGKTWVRLEGREYPDGEWSVFKISYRNGAGLAHIERSGRVVTECYNQQLQDKGFTIGDILREMHLTENV